MAERQKIYGEHIDCDPTDIIEPLRLLSVDYADAKAAYEFLDDMKKVILSQQKGEAEAAYQSNNNKSPTEGYLERSAQCSLVYIRHLESLNNARRKFLIAQANYLAEDKRIELLRSLESSARSQLNKLPGN